MRVYGLAGDAYLADVAASASLAVRVWDVPKHAEAATGADFVVVLRVAGLSHTVRKLAVVQAKRQEWGKPKYAASTNHVAKARAMLTARGSLDDCFFAYYHDATALSAAPFPPPAWPTARRRYTVPPTLFYSFAADGPSPYLAPHPRLGFSTFVERSGYRQAGAATLGLAEIPAVWSWGVGVCGAGYFIDKAGRQLQAKLPPISHVSATGQPLDEWLVSLAECRAGTPILTDAELNTRLADVLTRRDDQSWIPSCVVEIGATQGRPRHGEQDGQSWRLDVGGLVEVG